MNAVHQIIKVVGSQATPAERVVVREFPVRLRVNGRELVTLIASPHQLSFLVAGFLRLQGLIESRDDLLAMGICAESGSAEVRIRRTLPATLRPILTSGCGTGIVFHGLGDAPSPPLPVTEAFPPAAIVELMAEMNRRAERYASHGGIHAAAVGDGRRLLLHAEDLGRHNTIDRLAGEALLSGIDLRGGLLTTSGRISSEMLAKAAHLGLAVVASHTAPTSLAVVAAQAAGITLIGYLRGSAFEIYTHPERIVPLATCAARD